MMSGPFLATLAVRYLVNALVSPGSDSICTVRPGLAASKRPIAWEM